MWEWNFENEINSNSPKSAFVLTNKSCGQNPQRKCLQTYNENEKKSALFHSLITNT